MTTFPEQARAAFRNAKTLEQFSRALAFLDDPRFMKLPPETRISIRRERFAAERRLRATAGAD